MSNIKRFKRFVKYEKKALRLIKLAHERFKLIRTLNSIAPIYGRQGNITIYHSFTEAANHFQEQGSVYQDSAVFFWLQASYLGENFSLIVAGSPTLQALTGIRLPF